jgi:hypothetical protein
VRDSKHLCMQSILDEIEFYRAAQWGKKEITLKQTIMYLEDSQPSKVYQIGRIVEIFKKGLFVKFKIYNISFWCVRNGTSVL